jgi:hypothetical protein
MLDASAREAVIWNGFLHVLLRRFTGAGEITANKHTENDRYDDTGNDSGSPVGFAHLATSFSPARLLCVNGADGASVVIERI